MATMVLLEVQLWLCGCCIALSICNVSVHKFMGIEELRYIEKLVVDCTFKNMHRCFCDFCVSTGTKSLRRQATLCLSEAFAAVLNIAGTDGLAIYGTYAYSIVFNLLVEV